MDYRSSEIADVKTQIYLGYLGINMQRPSRTSRAEQAERDFNAHMAQLVDKESPEWVLEAKHREALDPLPAGTSTSRRTAYYVPCT